MDRSPENSDRNTPLPTRLWRGGKVLCSECGRGFWEPKYAKEIDPPHYHYYECSHCGASLNIN